VNCLRRACIPKSVRSTFWCPLCPRLAFCWSKKKVTSKQGIKNKTEAVLFHERSNAKRDTAFLKCTMIRNSKSRCTTSRCSPCFSAVVSLTKVTPHAAGLVSRSSANLDFKTTFEFSKSPQRKTSDAKPQ
jgi:cytochrome c2